MDSLEITDGPFFHKDQSADVAVFRVRKTHPKVGTIKLGIHLDDWVPRAPWHLTDAIVLGYPPVPLVNEPVLIAARAEINAFVVPRHSRYVHFILSATPRGGFSGGVAIMESGEALGLVTSSFLENNLPEQNGFFAVLSIEAILGCLAQNGMYPDSLLKEHSDVVRLPPETVLSIFKT